jgi:hypothetical protein
VVPSHERRRALSHDSSAEQAGAASGALGSYLDGLIAMKIDDPAGDVLSEMAARVAAGEMTRTEAASMGVAILIAGHETGPGTVDVVDVPLPVRGRPGGIADGGDAGRRGKGRRDLRLKPGAALTTGRYGPGSGTPPFPPRDRPGVL